MTFSTGFIRNRPGGLAAVLCLLLVVSAAPAAAQHEGHGAHGEDPHAAHRAMLEKRDRTGGASATTGGLTIPDVPVVDQEGRERSFYSELVRDRVVAMNFVFSTCSTVCPPMGANFGKLASELGDRLGRDVHLISVSVDPVTDTPERMKEWGGRFGATTPEEGWTLVTGKKDDVTRLLKSLQVFTPDFNDHAPTILVGNDATGEWTRTYGLAPPESLAELLAERAGEGGGR